MSHIAKGWGAPIIWDEVFSSIILEVAKDLNIDVTAEVNKRGNCLFIRITSGSQYSIIILNINISNIFNQASHNNTFTRIPRVPFDGFFHKDSFANININGLDVTEKDFYDDYNDYGNNRKLVLNTCIGVRNHWFNEKLFPKLYDKNLNTLTNFGLLVETF